jgi:hypothetical protein
VEKRERGGEWIKVNNYPTPNTSFTVQDLREGSRYEFRVIAVNEAGPGKPSKPTEPITAEAQRCMFSHFKYSYNRTIQFSHILYLYEGNSESMHTSTSVHRRYKIT